MVNSLEELWEKRLFNQKFPLIGAKEKGEGNGFHDRISHNVPHHLVNRDSEPDDSNWLYSVYFRDLSNFLNPQYKNDRGKKFLNSIQLENCSENFQNTFLTYIGGSHSWRNDELLELIGRWSYYLCHYGRIVFEFVGWYDNNTGDFYAYELKQLNNANYKIKKECVLFSAPIQGESEEIKNITVEIPKSKCIIIEWPKELGGFRDYNRTVKSVLKLGNKYSSISETISMSPGESVKKMKDWDLKFNSLISKWGTTHPLEDTTEFYKQYNFFLLKGTLIYCTNAIIDGLNQLIRLLNTKLGEQAKLIFNFEEANLESFNEMKTKWLEGKLSFKESSKYLTFN